MPSLFSRSHQAPKKDRSPAVLVANGATSTDRRVLGLAKTWNGASAVNTSPSVGEFGTVPKHASPHHGTLPATPDLSNSESNASLLPNQSSFLTTQAPSGNALLGDNASTYGDDALRQYGIIGGVGRIVVLGLDDVARVIRDVGDELGRRALDTPMLFSNQSLELSPTRMKLLIQTFMKTLRTGQRIPTKAGIQTFDKEIQFAKDEELAWLLRWALSRMTRVRESTREICHGCIDWEAYEEWRGRERAAKYPFDAFNYLSSILPPDVYTFIVQPLFALLSRFAAHSLKSGLTPHALASVFAPLLFDMPSNSPCLTAHAAFVRAAYATEHLLLSYIRSTGKQDGLGLNDLPFRLAEWVKGYPTMVATDAELARAAPRRAARTVRCHVASRTVRAYSRDLIIASETWADDIPTGWDAWDQVVLKSRRGDASRAKFSTNWRRKMAVKETLPLPASKGNKQPMQYGAPLGAGGRKDEERDEGDVGKYSTLAGKEWSAFEESGFDMPKQHKYGKKEEDDRDIQQRLQFDLNESAKMSVAERRQTMNWSEFENGGFSRTESFLTASLTFSAPVKSSITEWPKERDELRRRLQKTQKEATPFSHDTTPRVGRAANYDNADSKGRVYIETAFVDCWADLMMGCGWTDREELTFKEASWALIEYKAKPERADDYSGSHPSEDPRTTVQYFLFEERVPLEYQMAVADPKRKKSLHNIFRRKKEKHTLDPRPMNDFDKMLNRGLERKLTLSRNDQSVSSSLWHTINDGRKTPAGSMTKSPSTASASTIKPNKLVLSPSTPRALGPEVVRSPPRSAPTPGGSNTSPPKQPPMSPGEDATKGGRNIFKKSIRRVKSGTDQREKFKKQHDTSIDFEIQTASGLSSGTSSPQDGNEEKWMDILIANGARPMDRNGHDRNAPLPSPPLPDKPYKRSNSSHSGGGGHSPSSNDITPTATTRGGLNVQAEDHHARHPVLGSPMKLGREPENPYRGGYDPSDFRPSENYDSRDASNEYARSVPSYYDDQSHRGSVMTTDDMSVQPSDSISMRRRTVDSPPGSPRRREPADEVLTSHDDDDDDEESNRNTAYLAYDEIVSPKPRVATERDAIFSIVDRYGDARDSRGTTHASDADGDEPQHRLNGGAAAAADDTNRDSVIEQTYASERVNSAYGGIDPRGSVIEETYAAERANSAYSTDDTFPPPPIFDLTPGREPSPARYKHGEPLQFVGEEEEEEF